MVEVGKRYINGNHGIPTTWPEMIGYVITVTSINYERKAVGYSLVTAEGKIGAGSMHLGYANRFLRPYVDTGSAK